MRFPRRISIAAFLIAAFVFFTIQASATTEVAAGDIRVQDANATRPQLFFACDRPSGELDSLFTPQLVSQLKQLNAGVALSTEDFSDARAQVVHRLSAAGIPMIAWIVLPKADGYYVNSSDAPQAALRFDQFNKWTADHDLHWQAVGLDIEPNFNEFAALKGHKWRLLWMIVRRAFDSSRVQRARKAYEALIQRMQARGYVVQTYQLMFIVHERKVHTTLLERIFGIVNVRGNQEVLMLYTSPVPQLGAALIWQFGPDAQVIAVGSTDSSGDAATDAKSPPLNWSELSRDLLVAHHFSPVIGIYNLEGCVRQGFIPRLETMDWTQAVVIPGDEVKKAARLSEAMETGLWVGSHLLYFVAAFLIIVIWLIRLIMRRCARKSTASSAISDASK